LILENGDSMYKSLNTNNYLMISELPDTLILSNIHVTNLESNYGILSGSSQPGLN